MRLLRFSLYLILFVCALWALLVTAGSWIITVLIKQNFDNTVSVSGLRVTPKLGITADRVDYIGLNLFSDQTFNGFSRAIKIHWGGILKREPFIYLSVGPTFVESFGTAQSQQLFLS